MDFARSCLKRNIRFVAGDPSKLALATWYFCKPGAIAFPTWHRFGLSNWDSDHPTTTVLGDQSGPSTWYNGRPLNWSLGLGFAGPLDYFQQGAPGLAVLPRATDGFTPVVCIGGAPSGLMAGGLSVASVSAEGGKKAGGTCTQTSVPLNCGTFGTGNLTVTVLTGTGYWAPFVGSVVTMTYSFGVWTGSVVAGGHTLNLATACGAIVANQFRLDAIVFGLGPTVHGTPNAATDPFSIVVTFVDGVNVMTVQFSG